MTLLLIVLYVVNKCPVLFFMKESSFLTNLNFGHTDLKRIIVHMIKIRLHGNLRETLFGVGVLVHFLQNKLHVDVRHNIPLPNQKSPFPWDYLE